MKALALVLLLAIPADDEKKIDALFAAYAKPGSPGCVVGVVRNHRFVFKRAYGLANLEQKIPLTSATVMDPGSITKQFTAACIALLAQRGKLTLDDDVRRYIPELPVYARPITLRHLLLHTSGIRDYPPLFALQGTDPNGPITTEQTLAMLARQRELNFTPGTDHLYDNSGYFLLALVVRRVSGKSLRDFAQENLFTPLGMANTQIIDAAARSVAGRAMNYEATEDGGYQMAIADTQTVGDGGVLTTLDDLQRWDDNFSTGKAGGAALMRLMVTPGTLDDGEPIEYAFGNFVRKYKGLRIEEHGGDGPGLTAYVARFPEQHLTAMCLCNVSNFGTADVVRKVAEIALGSAVVQPAAASLPQTMTLTTDEMKPREGMYRSRTTDVVRHIRLADGKLHADLPFTDLPRKQQELAGESRERFRVLGGTVRTSLVWIDDDTFRLERDGRRPEIFERVAEAKGGSPAEFAGLYYSDDIDGIFSIRVDGDHLQVTNVDVPLRAVYRDGFSGNGVRVRFTRNAQGRIDGFLAFLGYNRGIRYRRLLEWQ